MRWKFAKNIGPLDNSELTASRCQLDDVAQVTWEPSGEVETYDGVGSSIALAKNREIISGLKGNFQIRKAAD
ncbi:hypothetical protein AgCh_004976 [Apium graveolens]